MERPKKGAPRKKGKGSIELPRQKSLLDMFPPKAGPRAPRTVITLESSPEILDTVSDLDYSPVAAAPAGGVAVQNEPPQSTQPASSGLSESSPPLLNEPQTPSNSAICLPEPILPQQISPAGFFFRQKIDGMTPSKPIVVDSSPVRESNSKPLPKRGVIHPFFVPRGNTTKQKAPQKSQSTKGGWPVPYPDCVSQHVRGSQTLVLASSIDTRPRYTTSTHAARRCGDSGYAFLVPGLHSPHLTPNRTPSKRIEEGPSLQQYASTIPGEHLIHHPSISRIVDRSISGALTQASNGRTLAEKWRPRCAEEVLGNEMSARYLRDWLRAFELQLEDSHSHAVPHTKKDNKVVPKKGRKRSRVITEVVRARYRKRARTDSDEEDQSWIVNGDEEGEEAYSFSHYLSDFDANPQQPSSSPMQSTCSLPDTGSDVFVNFPDNKPQDLGELHNTILLVGPPGSGKTASVYACAEELGWEVFEVYPGIGKRSGGSIENLVGEVGKNHLVRQRPHGRHDFLVFNSPSKRKQGLDNWTTEPDSLNRSSAPLTDSEIEDSARDRPAPLAAQSLILLEEVDILYKEDHRFWETVKSVIRECKRPIICTCNDLSLVPLADLPIQRVLTFDACPSDVAMSYLKGICCAEGQYVDGASLENCIASREGHEENQGSSANLFDLRGAINALDLSLTGGFPQKSETLPSGPTLDSEPPSRFGSRPGSKSVYADEILGWLKKAGYEADLASCVDSELGRNKLDCPAAIEIESLGPTADDEMGHPILNDTRRDASLPSTYSRDIEMGTIISGRVPREAKENQGPERLRKHYENVVREVCPARVRQGPWVFTDYAPWIKQVAEAEDAQAAAMLQQAQAGRGRRTRNSALSTYYPTLNLSEQAREALAAICFRE